MTATRRPSALARTRITVAALVAGCVGLVGVAVAGQQPVGPGLQFAQVGHWVYNATFQSAFHVDGSTGQVDARVSVPDAEPGSQVAQGEKSGYVVERSRITVFSKSTLGVENAATPPATEQPVVLEVGGGPYLVYRNAGQVVRLGDPMATVPAGGPLSEPAVTGDGSLWLHRVDTGSLCELPRDATRLSCPAQLEPGHNGSLTVVDGKPAVVDTTTDALRTFGKDGFGESAPLGVDLPASARVATATVSGRVAVVDPDRNRLHLVDTAALHKRPAAKPVEVGLPKDSRIAGPVATDKVVTVVDETRAEVRVYDGGGTLVKAERVPGDGTPRLSRGEDDRVYVDSQDGSHVLVVDGEKGSIARVEVGAGKEPGATSKASSSTSSSATTTTTTPTTTTQPASPEPPPERPVEPPARTNRPVPPPVVAAATAPGAPGGVSATADDSAASVSWGPAADNGAPVTAYHLSWPGGSITVGGGETGATVGGLANGTSYVITVAAENSAGRGPGASAAPVMPLRIAAAPAVTAAMGFGGLATVSWQAPDLGGGTLVEYVVSASGQDERRLAGTTTQYTGLSGTVTFTVRAVTRFGPAGSPTVLGAPGSATAEMSLGWPTAKITGVRKTGPEAIVITVEVDTAGSATTCEASVNNPTAPATAKVPCAGTTEIPLGGVVGGFGGGLQVFVTPTNGFAQGLAAQWYGVPTSGPGGPAGKSVKHGTGMTAR